MANSGNFEVAKAFVTIVPSMEGSQAEITKELTGVTNEAAASAGKESGDTFGVVFFGLAFGALAFFVVFSGFGVGGDDTFEVTQNNFVRALRDDIVRHHRGFATTAGSVNHKGGNSIARGMTA